MGERVRHEGEDTPKGTHHDGHRVPMLPFAFWLFSREGGGTSPKIQGLENGGRSRL